MGDTGAFHNLGGAMYAATKLHNYENAGLAWRTMAMRRLPGCRIMRGRKAALIACDLPNAVLGQPLGLLDQHVYAQRSTHLPVVLSRAEVVASQVRLRIPGNALSFEFAVRRVCVRIDRTETGNGQACPLTQAIEPLRTECIESGAAATASIATRLSLAS